MTGSIGVVLLNEDDDVLLASRHGKWQFVFLQLDSEFQSRTSMGVRGMKLKGMMRSLLSILHKVGTTTEEREDYLRFAPWKADKEGELKWMQSD